MSLRILIVEDEPLIAMDLQGILEDARHTVVGVAASSRDALGIVERSLPIDLAVMDVDLMGGVDGVETARLLRVDHGIASLFVSGRLTDEVRAMALAWEPAGFVSKPFGERDLLAAIGRLPHPSAPDPSPAGPRG